MTLEKFRTYKSEKPCYYDTVEFREDTLTSTSSCAGAYLRVGALILGVIL